MNDFADVLDRRSRSSALITSPPQGKRGAATREVAAPLPPVPLFRAHQPARAGRSAFEGRVAIPGGKGCLTRESGTRRAQKKLKLYQPAHQRFYLVASSLVCERVRPARSLNQCGTTRTRERFSCDECFRRVRSTSNKHSRRLMRTREEYAFIVGQKGNFWKRIPKASQTSSTTLIEGEEQLPLFPMITCRTMGVRRQAAGGTHSGRQARSIHGGCGFQKQPNDPARSRTDCA